MDPFALDYYAMMDDVDAVKNNTSQVIYKSIIQPLTQVGTLSEPDAMKVSQHHIHRLVHIILMTEYLSLSRGTASLHQAMSDQLPVKFESPVISIIEEGGQVVGVQLENEVVKGDHFVVATTPPAALKFIPEHWQVARNFLAGVQIPEFTLPTFFLDRPLERGVWSFLFHQLDGTISYLTDAGQKNTDMVPSGKSIIQPWVCYPQSAKLIDMSNDEVTSHCVAEIERIFPDFSNWIEHIHMTRHPQGVPFHSTGHVRRAYEFMYAMDQKKISFCGDYLSGGYMESALWSAERAAKMFG